ncbi:MAG: leucine-rich repeat domain-containing protein [Saprospiraceae bacterium]|nr:leucine-rich repeat domain-containing protein [Saprospiraceae bacterium]
MNKLLLCSLFFYFTGLLTLSSQCLRYERFMANGNKLLKIENKAEEALIEFQAAQIAARECGLNTDEPAIAIQRVFAVFKSQRDNAIISASIAKEAKEVAVKEKVRADSNATEALEAKLLAQKKQMEAEKARLEADTARVEAEIAQKNTEIALAKADKLIEAFYFYKDRFALAYKGNKYGFINKEGEVVIDYKYDEALPFNENTGLSTVKDRNDEYLLDTLSHEYKNVREVTLINSETRSVSLSNLGLIKIPKKLGQCEQLNFLWLSNNKLRNQARQEFRWSSLTKVDLSGNKFTAIPKWLLNSSSLDYLNLRSNELRNIEGINHFPKIGVLDLSYNKLKKIPFELSVLENIEILDISNNFLSSLPEPLLALGGLNTLILSQNRIQFIPDGIQNLKNLRYLDLSANEINHLPDSTGKLHMLEFLFLSRNRLDSLPGSLAELEQLKILDLSYNRLVELPGCIQHMKGLKELNLAGNSIAELPEWLLELKNLKDIYVAGNQGILIPTVLSDKIRSN